MPLEYLIYLNTILATRLVYLVNDKALSWKGAIALGCGQLFVCLVLFAWNPILWALALCIVLFTGLEPLAAKVIKREGVWRLISILGLALIPWLIYSNPQDYAFSQLFNGVNAFLAAKFPFDITEAGGLTSTKFLFGFLLLANEINILMRVLLQACNLKPLETSDTDETANLDVEEFNAGRVIGILERWLIMLIIIGSQDLSALGFIIAAKGLIRFKQLENNKDLAEYVLAGTLMSVLSALIVAKVIFTI